MRSVLAAVVATVSLLTLSLAHSETLSFGALLKGADEVPANDTTGTGQLTATLDTKTGMFDYKATYSGLTGPAVAAHFHGPAMVGVNAPPVIPIPMTSLASPITGTATLTGPQAADLEAGKWYFNVHTAAHKGGEIRGQLQMVK